MRKEISTLQRVRATYEPRLPQLLRRGIGSLAAVETEATTAKRDADAIRGSFPRTFGRPVLEIQGGAGPDEVRPLNVGVVLSGGQAPGGHNVIAGLCESLGAYHADSRLVGFLAGPRGIIEGNYRELTSQTTRDYLNTGGFDMIRSGRDKIDTTEQMEACGRSCRDLDLHGLVIIGGDDSNTNAAVLAEYFLDQGIDVAVVGVPKTIDGDLQGEWVETSFGFDTATKLYAELIGNICRDAQSAAKYWHFVKLMGRNASHVTLECALQTHVNIALIGEEVEARRQTLQEVVTQVAEAVRRRAEAGRSYGVCLVPEGLIEFIPEFRELIGELNDVLQQNARYFETIVLDSDRREFISQKLSRNSSYVFSALPQRIQQQLLLDRDSHGNVQVSRIDTERLLLEQVSEQIAQWTVEDKVPGKFQGHVHFLGYEGRCAPPSNFDADYTYALGHVAATLVAFGATGYICSIRGLCDDPEQWRVGGVPLTSMMQIEQRKGRPVPVIAKALVDLAGAPFQYFARARESWAIEDAYVYPGPIQYFGPAEVSSAPTRSLALRHGGI